MRLSSIILLILLLLWILFGAWLCSTWLCGIGGAGGGSASTGWHIHDGEMLDSNASEFVAFDRGSSEHKGRTSSLTAQLDRAAKHLKGHPERSLQITGFYDKNEKNDNKDFKNLGLARAENVKAYLGKLGVPAGQVTTAANVSKGYFWNGDDLLHGVDFNFRKAVAGAKSAAPIAAAGAALGAWKVADAGKLSASSPDYINFKESNHVEITPFSAGVKGNLKKTADHLKANKDRSLNIVGYYTKEEKNSSGVFANLGLARANNIKTHLVKKLGVASNQVSTEGQMTQGKAWYKNGILKKGVDFSFRGAAKADAGRIAAIKKRLFGKPLTVYFQTNQSSLNLSAQQRKDMADLMYYLEQVPSAKLEIGGHTDNVGSAAGNKALSGKRAKFVKDYLERNGLSARQMTSQGFGLTKPIQTNDTEDGRAKNRRVEVILR